MSHLGPRLLTSGSTMPRQFGGSKDEAPATTSGWGLTWQSGSKLRTRLRPLCLIVGASDGETMLGTKQEWLCNVLRSKHALAKVRVTTPQGSRPSGQWSDDDFDVLAEGGKAAPAVEIRRRGSAVVPLTKPGRDCCSPLTDYCMISVSWYSWVDSNHRPLGPQPSALTN